MALEVKIKSDGNSAGATPDSVTKTIRGMLRTCYGYANDVPEKIYLHCSIDKESNKVSFDVLFSIQGEIFTPQNLDKSKAEVKWDTSHERILSLHQYLGNDLFNGVIPQLNGSASKIPHIIQASYDIEADLQTLIFGYGGNSKVSKERWEKDVHSIDEDFTMNIAEFEYLNIDEGN